MTTGDQPMSIRTIKLIHSIPAIPGMPAPSTAKPSVAISGKESCKSQKTEIDSATPIAPLVVDSKQKPPLKTFYTAIFSYTAEFGIMFTTQLFFAFGLVDLSGMSSPYVLIGLSGTLVAFTLAYLIAYLFRYPKVIAALKPLHFITYVLCSSWLTMFVDLCFLLLGLIPLINLLITAGWATAFKRYTMWGSAPGLVVTWLSVVFFYATVSSEYTALTCGAVLSKQVVVQCKEVSQLLAGNFDLRLPLSLGLRFWWERFATTEPLSL